VTDTDLMTEEPEEEAPTVPELLEDLARTHLRTVALPLPRNPATLGWQSTAGSLATLAARMLRFVDRVAPERAADYSAYYYGLFGDGPDPLGASLWFERNVAKPAGAEITDWVANAKEAAEKAFAYSSRPTGMADLGVLLGDDVLSLLIDGLGASWEEWEEHGSTRRTCFVPGCTREVDLTEAWAGEGGARTEGWMSSPAVGFCCPDHVSHLWAGDHQHLPQWSRPTIADNAHLTCSCGWTSGVVRFRGHGTTLYGVHALEVLARADTDGGSLDFLGMPPSSISEQYIGRVTHLQPAAPMAAGVLTLPSGAGVPWVAHGESVRRHRSLFEPSVHVIVTAHNIGGPQYLTGIRRATDQEWQDAMDTLDSLPAASGTDAPEVLA
jgi:hypothetical protein